jgi:ribonucleotide monophosphatase NagD (HAD superfamily)
MHAQYPANSAVRAASAHDSHAPGGALGPASPGDAVNLASLSDVVARPSDLFIIRLDGIILSHGSAREGIVAWLRSIPGRYALVSSNSRDTARTMTAKLRRAGLDVPEQRIVLAGEEALRFVGAQFPGARCKILASRVLAHAARSHGLELVQDNPEVILLGRDSAWTYRDLALVVHELSRGARLIASNGDTTCQGHAGRPIPDTGAILAAIEAAAGGSANIIRFSRGATLRAAQERLGETGCEALVVSNQDEDFDTVPAIAGLRWLRFAPAAVDAPPGFAARPAAPSTVGAPL